MKPDRSLSIGMNMRVANLAAIDGNAAVMRSAARALAAQIGGHKLFLFVDSAPTVDIRESENVRFKVVRPFGGFNRALGRLSGGDPWYRLRLPVDSSWRALDAFVFNAHEPGPMYGGPKRVVIVHDLAFLLPDADRFFSPEMIGHLDRWTSENVHLAAKVVAVSHTTAMDVRRIYGVDAEKVAVLRNAHDPALFRPDLDAGEAEASLGRLGVARPYILHVGTQQPRKNVGAIIEAVGALRHRLGLPHRLVLAGASGWAVGGSNDFLKADLGHVQQVGAPSTLEIAHLMSAADALVMAGFYEGFGLPALEAMACGTPVVAARAGALPEVVGEAGALFDPNDPEDLERVLGELLGDKDRREEMRRLGIERALEFSWDAHAKGLRALIEGIAADA